MRLDVTAVNEFQPDDIAICSLLLPELCVRWMIGER